MKFILIIVQIVLLALGYGVFFNQWVTPQAFPYFNLLPLGFPIIFILNLCLLLFWWFYRWRIGLIFTLLSLPFLLTLNKTFHLFGSSETQQSNLKLVTYNVRYFFDDPDGILNLLKKENADIVLMQEMGPDPDYFFNNSFPDSARYFENFNSLGIASKYPIIEAQRFRIDKLPSTFAYADIALPNDTIRIINFYLESLHIDQQAVKEAEVDGQIQSKGEDLVKKVNRASRVHQDQIEQLREYINNSPYPIIVAGDMNAVPSTYEYYAIRRKLKDTFLYAGDGLGTTFPGFGYPLKLDYVFVSEEIKIKDHRIDKNNFSDHYPVIVEVEIP